MKKNYLFLVSLVLILLSSFFVLADRPLFKGIDAINLTEPLNASWNKDSNGLINFRFNMTGNSTNATCTLYHNINQVWGASSQTNWTVFNNTNSTLSEQSVAENNTGYFWNIGCNLGTDVNSSVVMAQSNFTISVDRTVPVPRPFLYGNSNWTNNNTALLFGVNVTELNPGSCLLETNLNESLNSSGGVDWWNTSANLTPVYVDRIPFNFTFGINRQWGRSAWVDNNTGAYKWNAACNDSAGNIGRIPGGNVSFWVDTTLPTAPDLSSPKNNSKSTDLTPLFHWVASRDLNFSRYSIFLSTNNIFRGANFSQNMTSNATNLTIVTGPLVKDTDYFVQVSAYDLAGNERNATTPFTYRTDSVCGTLIAGWNICAFVETNARNASAICDDIDCTYIAKYNSSHEFQTYTAGSSTNDEMIFNASVVNESFNANSNAWIDAVVFIYVDTNTSWENKTWQADVSYIFFNLTNKSTGWNLVPILNQTTTFNFGKLERSINANVTLANGSSNYVTNYTKWMSLYVPENATGAKYVPYVANKSINNNTQVKYGQAVWIHMNKSIDNYVWNSSFEII